MFRRRSCCPGLDGGRLHFNGLAAVAAQQVVVVPGDVAASVNRFAFTVAEDINESVVSQRLKDAVRGGQGD
ncbi:hypothetical protein D3C86_1937530 [compost metagenome]